MTKEKIFYAVTINVWDGTQFDEDEYISYYEYKNSAETAFEKAKSEIIVEFEEYYEEDDDSIKIVITDEDNMSDGERVCRIIAKNGDDRDCCVIRMRELKMIC